MRRVLATTALSILPMLAAADPALAAGTATLPASFGDFDRHTPAAADSPAGPAIAMYTTTAMPGDGFGYTGTVVVGAQSDTYRTVQVPGIDDVCPAHFAQLEVILSPDGTRALYPRPDSDDFTLLDLTTGVSRQVPGLQTTVGDCSISGRTYAWSPDGRYVAAAYELPQYSDRYGVEVLDLRLGRPTGLPVTTSLGAAFLPDGRHLLVTSHDAPQLFAIDDGVVDVAHPVAGPLTGADAAVSPDGTLVASDTANRWGCAEGSTDTITFAALADGATVPASIRAPGCSQVLGWRTPTSLLVSQLTPDGGQTTIVEYSTVDGSSTLLSRFSTFGDCKSYWHPPFGSPESGTDCSVGRVQLATALIGSIGLRPGIPPGPGPWWTTGHYLIVVAVGTVVLVGTGWVVTRVRRRRDAARWAVSSSRVLSSTRSGV